MKLCNDKKQIIYTTSIDEISMHFSCDTAERRANPVDRKVWPFKRRVRVLQCSLSLGRGRLSWLRTYDQLQLVNIHCISIMI